VLAKSKQIICAISKNIIKLHVQKVTRINKTVFLASLTLFIVSLQADLHDPLRIANPNLFFICNVHISQKQFFLFYFSKFFYLGLDCTSFYHQMEKNVFIIFYANF